ncbi:MAG: sigma-54 dependent transcriptional regulator [Myxococcota bacterium]|nr:sigma-54 dependent transcriptional regulator [Myxococcota bacterium]
MSGALRFLVVEDNDTLRRGIARALSDAWGRADEASAGDAAVRRLGDPGVPPYDLVVSDLRLPGCGGMEVLEAALRRDARTVVILMTAYGTIDAAVEAMRRGAFDFVQKPFELEQLEVRVGRALEHGKLIREVRTLRAERAARFAPENLVGASPALAAATELARRVAGSRSTVLVTGETGTGKELIAGLIHGLSSRCEGPFVKVNCAALPETLLESELFGHERGAFTGADRTRVGRFEQAHGGTLFLDEVGDMAGSTQAKLLRVLQDGEFHRLGGAGPIRADVRIVGATNRELEQEVREGRFREDLYFRLNVIRIQLPPLRERVEDLEPLARHFLAGFSRDLGRPARELAPAALERIRSYPWPGNVRELRNVLERAVLLADGERIEAGDFELPGGLDLPTDGLRLELPAGGVSLREVEQRLVEVALERSGWVQKDAAALLGVSRRKLNYMIQRMGITHRSWRRNRGDG